MENYVTVLFQIGDYREAVKICAKTIKENRKTETLQYVLAISLYKLGSVKEANSEFDSLLLSYPNHLAGNNEKASVLAELEQYDDALSYVERALKINPGYAEGFLNKGNILAKLKKYDDSIFAYKKALSLNENLTDVYLGCANVFRELKRYHEAFATYDRALLIKPNLAGAWNGRGNVFFELKRYDEALTAYDKALALKPDLAEAWLGRGNVFTEFNSYDDALTAYDNALAIKPDSGDVWLGRGNVFTELKCYDDAFTAYDKALAFKPAEAWLGRGNVLTELKRYDDAVTAYDKALALKPDLAEAWLGRGNVFAELKRYDDAFAAYDKALALKPDLARAWDGRGNVFTELRRYDEAFAAYDRALELQPDMADAYWDKSLAKLCVGNFEEGWDLYEWRSKNSNNIPLYPYLRSLNTSIRQHRSALIGKKIAVLPEQGVGDEIMFASILPNLISDAKTIFYEVDPRLMRLFASAFPGVTFVPKGSSDYLSQQAFDVVLQAGSLGYTYRREYSSFPRVPYLNAEPIRINKWKEILTSEAGSRIKIGISWRGGTDRTRRNDRSIELKKLYPLIQRDDCHFVSLQYGNVNEEILRLNNGMDQNVIHCLLDDFNNFDDFAALIMALDLVISVQNTTIHMCGALGQTCWGMIPWRPEWRYGNCSESMTWYSSIRLYRQHTPGNWGDVISLINSNLTNVVGDKAND